MWRKIAQLTTAFLATAVIIGCGNPLIFNSSFINQSSGELFPLTPGDRASFVLVRGQNATSVDMEFLITAEYEVASDDEADGLKTVTEHYRLFTPAASRANDLGVLVECSGLVRVGLGENLDQPNTDSGVFVGASGVGVGGFGVPAGVNPLTTQPPASNFDCGDTIVFQASESANSIGGVAVNAFRLDDDTQADDPLGRDTFVNVRSLIEEQWDEEL